MTPTSAIRTTRPAATTSRNLYDRLIQEHATLNGLRADLVRGVIQVESAFNPRARSTKGAMGLMQLMPQVANEFGVLNAYDPAENIRAGTAYLRRLIDRYQGNEELALAAYNAGPGAVERYGQKVPPYRETRDYVSRIRTATSLTATYARRVIYKTQQMMNGRLVPFYSDTRPTSGTYEVIPLR